MTSAMPQVSIPVLGYVQSCFEEKFGIPRQAGLVPDSGAIIRLLPQWNPEMLSDLEDFSHIWIVFLFHAVSEDEIQSKVRPPRLGGKEKRGVLATRSPHRPSRVGLSLVELISVCDHDIHIKNHDLLDGTPVIDIKPYLPWAEQKPDAVSSWAGEASQKNRSVRFSERALEKLQHLEPEKPKLRDLITQVLLQDPRPASQVGKKTDFGIRLDGVNFRWKDDNLEAYVTEVERT